MGWAGWRRGKAYRSTYIWAFRDAVRHNLDTPVYALFADVHKAYGHAGVERGPRPRGPPRERGPEARRFGLELPRLPSAAAIVLPRASIELDVQLSAGDRSGGFPPDFACKRYFS